MLHQILTPSEHFYESARGGTSVQLTTRQSAINQVGQAHPTLSTMAARTQQLGQHIEALIRRDAAKRSLALDERALRRRVDDYYLPMFRWTTEVVEAAQKKQGDAKRCVCIGLSCPQGGGKTTVSMYMQETLALMGKKCAVMSLDDVYWKYEQQVALAKANPGNPLLQVCRV
ncbi:unnamed protein product [Phytophthora fragariaefolia]|uniref:Unnamed protein product n=1 Tax=Phytophthora fragariaefolia TaxID=1490495 RepID=A0A9W6U484_9STRA|nr:unnamed protein product [Phytophthora fragariaefolia]